MSRPIVIIFQDAFADNWVFMSIFIGKIKQSEA